MGMYNNIDYLIKELIIGDNCMRPTKYRKDKTPIFICKLHMIL